MQQTVYTFKVKKSHVSKVHKHKDKMHVVDEPPMAGKLHMENICFPIEAYKQ